MLIVSIESRADSVSQLCPVTLLNTLGGSKSFSIDYLGFSM